MALFKILTRGVLHLPQFDFPFPCRYNTLRLPGCDYDANARLCAISLVTDLRRPLFADVNLAKRILKSLMSKLKLANAFDVKAKLVHSYRYSKIY